MTDSLSADDWSQLLDIAEELGVATLLWRVAQPWRDQMPASVADELHHNYLANSVRNLRLRQLLGEALGALNETGIVPVLLKGAVHLTGETNGMIGDWWMADLDLLIRPTELPTAEAALKSIGLQPDTSQPWVAHEVPFYRSRDPGPIDVHLELGTAPLPSLVPEAEARVQSIEVSMGDTRARILSPTHQVIHSVVHSAVQELNHVASGLPLRQLLMLAALVREHGDAIDWLTVRERMEQHQLGHELADHLWLAQRYAGLPLPRLPGRWSPRARWHEAQVLLGFGLGWPTDMRRNVRLAFGRAYLESLYQHDDRPLKLARARARHAARIIRRDGLRALNQAVDHKA